MKVDLFFFFSILNYLNQPPFYLLFPSLNQVDNSDTCTKPIMANGPLDLRPVRIWLGGWVAGRLAGWLTGWSAGWQVGWLADWLTGLEAGWLTGLLADWLTS